MWLEIADETNNVRHPLTVDDGSNAELRELNELRAAKAGDQQGPLGLKPLAHHKETFKIKFYKNGIAINALPIVVGPSTGLSRMWGRGSLYVVVLGGHDDIFRLRYWGGTPPPYIAYKPSLAPLSSQSKQASKRLFNQIDLQ